MGNLNKIFNSLNVVSEGSSYNTIGFKVSKSGSTANPGITSFIVRDDSSTGVNTALPTSMLTVSGDCRITDLPFGGRLMVTTDAIGKLHHQPIPGFPTFSSGCTLTGITISGPVITFHLVGTGCTATTFTASTTGQVIGPYEIGAGLNAIQPILPPTNLADAQFSNIQGGNNNQVQVGSGWSNILGGLSNRLINNSRWSSIVGGIGNRLDDAQVSTIVGGQDNRIQIAGGLSGYGAILNGFENTVNHQYSVIMGGANMTTDRDFTVFMRGLDVNTTELDPTGPPQELPFRYHGIFANPGLNRVLRDSDGLGNAVWSPFGFPDPGSGCTVTGITVVGPVITFHTTGPGCSGATFTASTVSGTLSPYEYRAINSISTVLPNGGSTTDNFISSGQFHSNSQGGYSNKINTFGNIQQGGQNAIGGGRLNVIGGTNVKVQDGNVGWSNIGGGWGNRITGYDQNYMNISGGRKNKILNSGYGHIGGGNENIMTASTRSFIGGGESNHIRHDSYYSAIGGGVTNVISSGQYGYIGGGMGNDLRDSLLSVIGGGMTNEVWNSASSFIGGGLSNSIGQIGGGLHSENNFIGGGYLNHITDKSVHSGIVGGDHNSINNESHFNFIGGGVGNYLGNKTNAYFTNYSSILGGKDNGIYGDDNSHYAAIVNGSGNTIEHANYSAIIGGKGVTANRANTTFMEGLDVDTNLNGTNRPFRYHGIYANNGNVGDVLTAMDAFGNASWQPKTWGPISGDCYVVSATTDSGTCITTFYLNGTCGTLTAQTCDGSFSPYRPTGNQSIVPTIPGGISLITNVIDPGSNNSNVGGGILNRILGGSTNAVIAGGRGNRILNTSVWSNIGGGVANIIDDSAVSSIVGGHHNEINIPGFASGYGLIGAGFENTVNNRYGTVINGANNTVSDDFSAIIGAQNKTTDRTFTTFTEGLDVDSARANGTPDGQSFKYHGAFANPGLNRVLTDVDGAGTAQWRPVNFPPVDPDCGFVSAFTTNSGCTLNLIDCSGNTVTADTCNTFGSYSPYQFGSIGGINSIEPVMSPNSANATWSSIGGGGMNQVLGPISLASRIGGGTANWIMTSGNGYIGGGMGNQILDTFGSVVTGGVTNWVRNSSMSAIVGGSLNQIGAPGMYSNAYNFIGGGQANFMSDNIKNSSIVGGMVNSINNYSDYNFIGGGAGNYLGGKAVASTDWTNYSSILGGKENRVLGKGLSYYAGIVNGSGNTVASNYSAIIGGRGLTANRSHTTFMQGLDVDTDHDGVTTPFRYHGTYANHGLAGDVLTSVDALGNAHWAPGGVVWTYGCPILSATSTNCILTLINCTGGTITADTCNSFGMLSPYEYRGGLDSITTILPDETVANTNFIYVNLPYSNIQGGESNSLNSSGQYNAILGGDTNYIGAGGGPTIVGGPPPPPPQGNISWSNIGGGSDNQIRGYDVMGDVIAGGRYNVVTATTYGVISGGFANRLNKGDKNYIGGGGQNTIFGDEGNAIVGGLENSVYNGNGNIIGGGGSNTITEWVGAAPIPSSHSLIGGGWTNIIKGSFASSIVGGYANSIISSEPAYMFIGGGQENSIDNAHTSSIVGGFNNSLATSYTFIGGGEDNTIINNSIYSSILGGFQNTINPLTGNANYSAIVNGSDNTIQHIYSAIIGGANLITNRQYTTFMEGLDVDTNRGGATNAQAFKYHGTFANNGNVGDVLTAVDALGNAKWQPIGIRPISGDCYVVSATTNSATCVTTFYLNGTCGTLTAQTCDGSFSPYRPTGNQSIVPTFPGGIAWNTNVIDPASNNSNVGGGILNWILGGSTNSLIAGGRGNRILNASVWSNIGGGVANRIDDGQVSSIVGGHHNEINITGFASGYGLIGAGFQNTVSAQYGSIINGRDNTVAGGILGDFSAIIGAQNKTTDRTYTTFMEGLDVDTNRADGSLDGQAFRYYGTFASPGMRRVLTDSDGFGNAVWMDLPNPPQDPGCPFVSAFTTNSGCTLHLVNCTGGTFTADTCNTFGGVSPYTIGAGVDSIEPVMMIGSANANYSNVQGGQNNFINSGAPTSSIVGGQNNSINVGCVTSFIGNGYSNTITTSSKSSIVGGQDNVVISKSDVSSIVGGLNNMIVGGTKSIIGAGELNKITGTTKSIIGAGDQNKIFNSEQSNISAGKFNEIIENSWYSHIGAGTGNVIKGSSAYNAIAAGDSNLTTDSSSGNRTAYSFIGAGSFNILSGASWSTIVSGLNNKIIDTGDTPGAILTGQYNLIKDSEFTAIINGKNNTINGLSFDSSAVIGADDRVVDRDHTTFMEGLDADTNRGGVGNAQAFKYHGTFASPGINRILTDDDGLGNAVWKDSGIVHIDPDCAIVSAYTTNSGCTLNLIDCSGNTFTATTCTTFGSYSPYQIGSTGAFQSIEPVLSPGSANAFASSVGGGGGNIIQGPGGWMARIGGGGTNSIFGDSAYSYIGAGHANAIDAASLSAIIAGNLNMIKSSNYSIIGGGFANKIGTFGSSGNEVNFIGGGNLNEIMDETAVSSIVGGYRNSINNNSDFNFIGGGDNNRLGQTAGPLWTNYSSILGGKDNEIAGDTNADYAAIVNGSGNTVSRNYSAVIGGRGLTADRTHTTFMQGLDVDTDHDGVTRSFKYHGAFANPGAGKVLTSINAAGDAQWVNYGFGDPDVDCYVVSASTATGSCMTTFYLGCSGLTVTAKTCDGSYSPYRPTGDNSIVPTVPQLGLAMENVADIWSSNSNIGGGLSNRIMSSDTSVISGGRYNRVTNGSNWSTIGGGVNNTVTHAPVSSIVGGHRNEINLVSGGYGLIAAGYENTVNARYGSIINGDGNTVSDDFSAIIGAQNKTTDRTYTTFMEGLDVDTNRASGSADGQAFKYHGTFASPGMRRVLTDFDGLGNAKWMDSGIIHTGDEVVVSAQTIDCILTLTTNSGNTITANTCTTYSGPYIPGQGANSIIPRQPIAGSGIENTVHSTGPYSTIQGGLLNHVSGSSVSTILGGYFNLISATGGGANSILGGTYNIIKNLSEYGTIVNGTYNTITTGTTGTVIMGTSSVVGYTDNTTYTENQQAHGKARISSQEYNTTNSLNNSLAKMTLDVVHDNGTIRGLGGDSGGGEIVRFGTHDPATYGKGKLVQLRGGQWIEADASDTTLQGNMLGIALGSSPSNEGVLIRGFYNMETAYDGNAWQPGEPLYVHNGAGQATNQVTTIGSEYVRNIGYCTDNVGGKYVYFNPESTYIVVQ